MRKRLGPDADIDVGWVSKAGEGLDRDVYAADIQARTATESIEGRFAALVPRYDAPPDVDERARREVELLARLARLDLPFEIPRWSTTVKEGDRTVLVREFLRGFPLDAITLPHDRFPPWSITGEIAAAVHAVPTTELARLLPGHPTRRAHAQARLGEADGGAPDPVTEDAIAWIRSHLPPDDPAVLLQGDLLGQNILLDFDGPRAVIDWEFSQIGDPAYDLAIVTRGARRPFKRDDGMRLLLDAYTEAGGIELRPSEIHVHELVLHINWHLESCRGEGQHPPEETRKHLLGVLRRAERSDTA
jgi:aminoglycoside phosphotransferase (APT) family kinase protein